MGRASDQAASFWRQVEQRAREIAQAEIALALQNLRPGGLVPVAVTIGAPTASLTVPVAHIDIPFPAKVRKVTFRSTVRGSATLDVTMAIGGGGGGVSLFRGEYQTITSKTDEEILAPRTDPGWIDFLPSNTVLYFYLRTVSGFDCLTVCLWLQATQS